MRRGGRYIHLSISQGFAVSNQTCVWRVRIAADSYHSASFLEIPMSSPLHPRPRQRSQTQTQPNAGSSQKQQTQTQPNANAGRHECSQTQTQPTANAETRERMILCLDTLNAADRTRSQTQPQDPVFGSFCVCPPNAGSPVDKPERSSWSIEPASFEPTRVVPMRAVPAPRGGGGGLRGDRDVESKAR